MIGAALAAPFPTKVRYTGSSITFNFAGIFGASLAPYAATWLQANHGIAFVGFYLIMAAIITVQFFSGVNETTGYIFALMAFAAGFAVRPFGAIVFGRLGDIVGRKYTFLVTILIMGLSTFLVTFLPTYASWGIAAPIALLLLRRRAIA